MTQIDLNQWLNTEILGDDVIKEWTESFIMDRKVQNMSPGTIHFYISKLKLFSEYCELLSIDHIMQITPKIIRGYLIFLEEKGHNPGGIHACYRVLKTFLLWWERENEPEEWKNPIHKVKAPKVAIKPLEPVSIAQVEALIATCIANDFYDLRDKALLLFLLDTGARAAETCALDLGDIDLQNGSVLIRSGKGRKPRTVFLGKKSRRALRTYLKSRVNQSEMKQNSAFWVTNTQSRLTYWGLNQILRRRAKKANISKPSLHDFRRAFALNYLRNGGDIYTLQKLMGHADLQVLRRYLAQTTEDLHIAHQNFSPVDNSGL
jgi:site-specific recombinase XerD